jgi:Flp pilus assembly protein TadG
MALSFLRRLGASENGSAVTLTAISVPLLMGAGGLAMDTVQWVLWKRQLQRSADSAALAGAYARAQSKGAITAAMRDLAQNLDMSVTGQSIENAPTAGPYAGDNRAVRVALSLQRRLPFTSYFLSTPPTLTAEATAAVLSNGNYCVISLEDTSATGIVMQGNSTVNLGCGMATNSTGCPAVTAGGSASIFATPVAAVGCVPASSNYATGTTLQPYSISQPDPFADVPVPPVPSNCKNKLNVQPNATKTIIPANDGTCFRGMDLKGNVTFAPGTYIIDGDAFDVGSQAVVSGTDVTFILTSSTAGSNPSSIATLNINGGATINLSAPETGTYAKLVFYQDRRAIDTGSNKVNGNAASSLQGGFYFPKQAVDFTGTSGQNTKCVQIVSRRVTFIGNSQIQNDCPPLPDDDDRWTFRGTQIRLVG